MLISLVAHDIIDMSFNFYCHLTVVSILRFCKSRCSHSGEIGKYDGFEHLWYWHSAPEVRALYLFFKNIVISASLGGPV